jgi:hypothetical protein
MDITFIIESIVCLPPNDVKKKTFRMCGDGRLDV